MLEKLRWRLKESNRCKLDMLLRPRKELGWKRLGIPESLKKLLGWRLRGKKK